MYGRPTVFDVCEKQERPAITGEAVVEKQIIMEPDPLNMTQKKRIEAGLYLRMPDHLIGKRIKYTLEVGDDNTHTAPLHKRVTMTQMNLDSDLDIECPVHLGHFARKMKLISTDKTQEEIDRQWEYNKIMGRR